MGDDTNTLYVRRFTKKSWDLGHGYSVKMVPSGRYYAFLSGRIIGGATETFDGAILLAQGHFDMLRDEVGADWGDVRDVLFLSLLAAAEAVCERNTRSRRIALDEAVRAVKRHME